LNHVFHASIGTAPHVHNAHSFYVDHQYCVCNPRSQMSFWKPKFKLAGKVFAILRKRPDTDGEETSQLKANSLARHDYSDNPLTPRPPMLDSDGSALIPRHDDPQSGASSSLGIRTSSANDSAHHAIVHPRYEAPCSERKQ
jgi:hypothetical protein